MNLRAASLLALLAAPASGASETGDPWPRIRKQRLRELLPQAMERAGVDAWVLICRENANDPLAEHVGGENASAPAAFVFLRQGQALRSLVLSPAGEARALRDLGLHDEVEALPRGTDLYGTLAARLQQANPARIAIDASSTLILADGLSSSQRQALEAALAPELRARLQSSEDLVAEWLSVKLPEEIEILRRAAALTVQLELEAYARVVPGQTRDSDVARFLKRRMAELGVQDAWAPDQNPNVNSGPDRGHSHATDKVIVPGDVIQTDFGVKVHGRWCTDIQRFAYVLRPGESQAPPEVQGRWDHARQGSRTALAALRPGVRGYDVDRAQRDLMRAAGSEPVPWGTGHPVGYWAHDAGPALSGAQGDKPPQGAALRLVRPGQTFAFDGFHAWKLPAEGETKTISVEEMAVVGERAAEYLVPPQERLILIAAVAGADLDAHPEEALQAAEQRLYAALQARDRTALAEALADDFRYSSPGAPPVDKQAFLATVATLPEGIERIWSDDAQVRAFGETGVVFGHQLARVRQGTQVLLGRTLFMDVFVKRDGRWLLSLAQGVELPEQPAGP